MNEIKHDDKIFNSQKVYEDEKPQKKRKKGKKALIIVLSCLLALVLLGTAAFYIMFDYYYNKLNIVPQSTQNLSTNPSATPLVDDEVPEKDDVYNILLIGTDARTPSETGRSDTMMLVTINPTTKRIVITSFMRDTYVEIPGHGSNRLNAAYNFGGAPLLKQTLKNYYSVNIDWYVKVDFTAFIQVIDAVGGVQIDVSKSELYHLYKNVKDLNRELGHTPITDGLLDNYGLQTLNGKQALGYARIRKLDSDFVRTSRQREVLKQLFVQGKAAGVTKLLDVADDILPLITTDIGKSDLLNMMAKLGTFLTYDLVQNRVPVDGTWKYEKKKNMEVIVCDFDANRDLLHDFMFGYAVEQPQE